MRIASLAFVVALTLVTASCDPGAGITWINETDESVDIYLGDDLDDFGLTVAANSSKELGTIEDVWEDVVIVRDQNGDVLLREDITWDELEAADFRFVIRSEDTTSVPDTNLQLLVLALQHGS